MYVQVSSESVVRQRRSNNSKQVPYIQDVAKAKKNAGKKKTLLNGMAVTKRCFDKKDTGANIYSSSAMFGVRKGCREIESIVPSVCEAADVTITIRTVFFTS